ncbi:hypothetical protein BpHYR1_036239 [Brachionus plicatilis]|uniref:Uncharacterized protein n=1 Tax=Brachionus plicatilis TaxID=10195 RepID=A0A3M7RH26_BRAPC|nr:hypothetical protein BpHYR1_036239 [Brachionus plicatilis]
MITDISRRELYEYAFNKNLIFKPTILIFNANSKKATIHFLKKFEIDCNESNEKIEKAKIKLTANEALSIFISCNLTQASYQSIRNIARQKNADIFPTYDEV